MCVCVCVCVCVCACACACACVCVYGGDKKERSGVGKETRGEGGREEGGRGEERRGDREKRERECSGTNNIRHRCLAYVYKHSGLNWDRECGRHERIRLSCCIFRAGSTVHAQPWTGPLKLHQSTDEIYSKAIVTKFIVSGHRPHLKRPPLGASKVVAHACFCQLSVTVARDVSLG